MSLLARSPWVNQLVTLVAHGVDIDGARAFAVGFKRVAQATNIGGQRWGGVVPSSSVDGLNNVAGYRFSKPVPVFDIKLEGSPPTLDPKKIGMTIGLDFIFWQGYPICNAIEFQSRYCLAALAFEQETAQRAPVAIRAALHEARRLGLPAKGVDVKSDKGSPLIADDFRKVLVENTCQQSLSGICIAGGTARVERFNRTTKEQGLACEDMEGLNEIQLPLNRHRRYYNAQRPHQAPGWLTALNGERGGREDATNQTPICDQ